MKIDILQNMQYVPSSLFVGLMVYFVLFSITLFQGGEHLTVAELLLQRKHVLLSLGAFYLTLMFYIVFWCREPGSRIQANLIIGGTWTRYPQGRAYVMENILLFVPVGLFTAAWFTRFRVAASLLFGVLLSMFIETTQYITQRGFLQIDDVWTNVLGSLLGACLFLFIRKFFICLTVYYTASKYNSTGK